MPYPHATIPLFSCAPQSFERGGVDDSSTTSTRHTSRNWTESLLTKLNARLNQGVGRVDDDVDVSEPLPEISILGCPTAATGVPHVSVLWIRTGTPPGKRGLSRFTARTASMVTSRRFWLWHSLR